ncbi:MAG: CHAT domain-containing protein [Cuspidothrix sp.]
MSSRQVNPLKWANSQNTLGSVYYKRICGNRVENLENAIFCYQAALEIYSYDKYPVEWALVKQNLGNLYSERIKGDNLDNLETAIAAFKSALTVYTQNEFPQIWATIQNGLGMAYFQRLNGYRKQNLEDAIQSLEFALQVFNRDDFPLEWSRTTSNLGNIYRERIEGDLTENQKIAISKYKKSLEITNKTYPKQWAETQNNLGATYSEMLEGDKLQNLNEAVHCYQEALKIRTYDTLPKDWAMTKYNLGNVYSKLGRVNEAIDCYQEIFKIYEPHIFPLECIKTGRDLGNIALNTQLSSVAIDGYSKAIEAVETSRSWIKSESRRQEILADSIDIYENIVQAYINTKQIDKAFEYSERYRSQRLVELMASSHLYQSENIPPKVQELLQKYEELQQQIDIERQNHKSENKRSETRAIWKADNNEKIASLETAKQEIWEQLRRKDPILAGEIQVKPLSLLEIQQLIDHPKTAILSFYTTNCDTHIFIITQKEIYLHTSTGEGLETLQNWIAQNWLSNYIHHPEKWENKMEHFLHELAEKLQLSKIINQYLQEIDELIIEPHLLLHQIPFAALPTGEYQEYLVDRFLIRYTPSCQILDFCHQNYNKKRLNLDVQYLQYGTITDTLDDKPLPFSRWEEEEISKMYNISSEKRLIGSSQATVKNFRKLAEQVQTLHSCHHAVSCLYNPLESQLNLGDGSITLGQLMSPGWRLPHLVDVFLSCCETNLDKPDITDNLLSLSTGFLCAGAISAISSLWQVDDLASALFSIFYYQQRQEGKNRPEALKKAQIKLRELSRSDLQEICKELRKADLEEISQASENHRKQARNQREQYPKDSVEYLECDRQYQKYAKISIAINNIQKSKGEFPFAHPRYWSAFIAQGLG